MTIKNLKSFAIALFLSGLVSGFVYILLFMETFDIFGLEEKRDPEAMHGKFFYTGLVMTALTTLIVIYFVRQKRRYTAIALALPNLIGLFLMLKFGIIYLDKSNYYESFDKKVWNRWDEKPIKMARGLIKDNVLVGQSKESVIKLLGNGTEYMYENSEHISYMTNYADCALGLTVEGGKIKTAAIWLDY